MEPEIRLLIVDDSALVREIFRMVFSFDERIEVVGQARNGKEAIELTSKLRPDIITMDISMPEMDGLEAIEHIMAYYPTPILVLTSLSSADVAFRSLSKGVLEVMEKPELDDEKCREFVEKIRLFSRVKVITHVSGKRRGRKGHTSAKPALKKKTRSVRPSRKMTSGQRIVAIGSSTGGPSVLGKILGSLPGDVPIGILIVQHISDGFVPTLVDWLDDISEIRVKEAQDGETVRPGAAYVAPAGRHMEVSGGRILLNDRTPVGGHRPSADVLFSSVAREYGPGGLGVILSGMGQDGALGMKEIHEVGGMTIAQDEQSCVVFGMPKVAIELGGVQAVLSPESIPSEILQQVKAQTVLSRASGR